MKKIEILEGLRGYMAVWVFITHALTLGGLELSKKESIGRLLANGDLPVTVFVILSGFVIAILLEKNESYKQYIIRRGLRLFPIYLVSLLISVLLLNFTLDTLETIPWQTSKNAGRIELILQGKQYFNISFISHLFLAHGLLPNSIFPTTYTLMGQAWSLTLEWQFYLVAPLLHKLCKGYFSPARSVAIVLILIITIVLSKIYMPQSSFLPNMLFFFAIGYLSRQVLVHFPRFLFPFLLIVLLIEIERTSLINIVPLSIWCGILYFYMTDSQIGKGLFANKSILFIGRCSYSFYCVHFFLLVIVSRILNYIGIDSRAVYLFMLLGIGFLLTVFVSHLTYKYIEMPAMKFGKKLRD